MSRKMTYRSEKFHKTAVTDTDCKCFLFFSWRKGKRVVATAMHYGEKRKMNFIAARVAEFCHHNQFC